MIYFAVNFGQEICHGLRDLEDRWLVAVDADDVQAQALGQFRLIHNVVAPVSPGHGHLPLHLKTVFGWNFLALDDVQGGRRLNALDLDQTFRADKAIR
jgi:hypothetical protein